MNKYIKSAIITFISIFVLMILVSVLGAQPILWGGILLFSVILTAVRSALEFVVEVSS